MAALAASGMIEFARLTNLAVSDAGDAPRSPEVIAGA
jgi:hypothetical protein